MRASVHSAVWSPSVKSATLKSSEILLLKVETKASRAELSVPMKTFLREVTCRGMFLSTLF